MPENYITCQDEKGTIHISEDVVLAMVRTAVSEVDGVAGLASSAGTELADLLGIKSAAKGIKLQIVDGVIHIDIIITVRYGCNTIAVRHHRARNLLIRIVERWQHPVPRLRRHQRALGPPRLDQHRLRRLYRCIFHRRWSTRPRAQAFVRPAQACPLRQRHLAKRV